MPRGHRSRDLSRCRFFLPLRPRETQDPGISKAPQGCSTAQSGCPVGPHSPVPQVAVQVVQEPKRQRNSGCSISFSLSAGRWIVYWYLTPGLVSWNSSWGTQGTVREWPGRAVGGGITPGASEERRTRPAGPEGRDPAPSSTPGLDGTWSNPVCGRCPCPWVEFPKLFPTPNGLPLLLWLTQVLLKAPPTPTLARAGSSSLFFLA